MHELIYFNYDWIKIQVALKLNNTLFFETLLVEVENRENGADENCL